MRYATTGPSRGLIDPMILEQAVRDMDGPTVVVSGGQVGWDVAFATEAVRQWPAALHRIIVPHAPYAADAIERLVLRATAAGVRIERIQARWAEDRRAATAYRYRNEEMIDQLDPYHVGEAGVLVAALRSKTFYRSGEWATLNLARTRPGVRIVELDIGPAR